MAKRKKINFRLIDRITGAEPYGILDRMREHHATDVYKRQPSEHAGVFPAFRCHHAPIIANLWYSEVVPAGR